MISAQAAHPIFAHGVTEFAGYRVAGRASRVATTEWGEPRTGWVGLLDLLVSCLSDRREPAISSTVGRHSPTTS